jgi:NADH-quinone oxidoreductase subunit A
MLSDFGHVGFLLIMGLIFPLGGIVTSYLFGWLRFRPQKPDDVKEDTYECGVPTEGTAWVQFHPRYYLIALVFLVFDVELVFLFPWAVSFGEVGIFGFVGVVVFLAVLSIGLIYDWAKGGLEWQ